MATPFLIFVLLILNFLISIWNAYAVGRAWLEANHAGGWPRFMAWMGAIMSASGFTWCYLIVLSLVATSVGWLPMKYLPTALSLGYLIIIPGVLFSGLMITVDSWAQAYRTRTLPNMGIAAYNTFAQIHNTASAISGMGEAFSEVVSAFGASGSSSDDSDDAQGKALVLVILIVLLALGSGILTTTLIVKKYAGSEDFARLPA